MSMMQVHPMTKDEVVKDIKSIEYNPSGGSPDGSGATKNVAGELYNKKKGGKK